MSRVLDLCAGMGVWDTAAAELGIHPVGVEHDASACLTRAAAGHLTIRQDVTTLDTARFSPLEGLIGSPPCPTFSAAGGRAGIAELRYLIAHVHACVTGWKPYDPPSVLGMVTKQNDDRRWEEPVFSDPRSALVLEPLRFALGCCPQWIALEQVPDVLPVWEAIAHILRGHAYSVWTGVLNSADFGVPQTRRRAILMAHRRIDVQPPTPTHCEGGAQTMFGELLPWVSMAEALGWTCVSAVDTRGNSGREQDSFSPAIPSRALTGKSDSWAVMRGNNTIAGGPLAERPIDEPAMTVGSRADLWKIGEPWILDRRQTGAPTLDTSAVPAPTLTAAAVGKGVWALTRPATTVCADPRLSPPGYRGKPEDYEPDGTYTGERSMTDALRLTETDALRLQSFPADYPVRGTKTKRFEQIGNAIPVVLARHILASLSEGTPQP